MTHIQKCDCKERSALVSDPVDQIAEILRDYAEEGRRAVLWLVAERLSELQDV